MSRRLLTLGVCLFCAAIAGQSRAADWLHFGFLYDDFPLTLTSGDRSEALGPLFYYDRQDSEKTWAFPPLLSRKWDPVTDYNMVDFAYPVVTYRRFGTEYRWHIIQVFAFAGGRNQQQDEARRFTLFPL